ncbi:protein late bloomer [Musca vetustissima]|uniref:protein late bloomer n=1 Tax=Musca vetustissima TaxID=27455 RepID=UPI002AB70DAE|nr:protein late bloomer [Musca vetustissima]
MHLSRTCLQWTVIVFNTMSVVLGILAVVASVFELQKYSYGTPDFTEKLVNIGISSVLVISAFVGCCAAVNGSVKMLVSFIVILLALVASHVWCLWRYDEERVRISTTNMVNYYWIAETHEQGYMDILQETYECCGKVGYLDYLHNSMTVPDSCYFFHNNKREFYPHGKGCLPAVLDAYLNIYRTEKWTHVGLMGFEFAAIIHIVVTILNYKNAPEVESMVMNYVCMLMSGVCSAAAFIESTIVLEILATAFLCEIMATSILWIYAVKFFCIYTLTQMVLHGIIAVLTYLLIHRLRKEDLGKMIKSMMTPAMMPLNPQGSQLLRVNAAENQYCSVE